MREHDASVQGRPDRRVARGGRLRTGNPRNAGGPGRPPRRARAEAYAEIDRRLPWLAGVASRFLARDGMRAMDMLAKIAAMDTIELDEVRTALTRTTAVIRAKLPAEQAEALLAAIAPHWTAL